MTKDEAVAQQQEPDAPDIAVVDDSNSQTNTMSWAINLPLPIGTPLYTSPPAKPWVGLTDDDGIEYPHPPAIPPVYATASNTKAVRDGFEMGGYEKESGYYSEAQLDQFAQVIEAKLKEKNT